MTRSNVKELLLFICGVSYAFSYRALENKRGRHGFQPSDPARTINVFLDSDGKSNTIQGFLLQRVIQGLFANVVSTALHILRAQLSTASVDADISGIDVTT